MRLGRLRSAPAERRYHGSARWPTDWARTIYSMRVTAIVGNGTSIVYNDQLAIGPLTTGIVAAFNALAGSDSGDALAAFAQQVHGQERDDFEGLLGPLDAITQALPLLGGVDAPFAGVPSIANPLQQATTALRRLHRLGLGTALRLIAERSQGQGDAQLQQGPGALAKALVDLTDGDLLTLATLNYDGLLQAVLPDENVADLATGLGHGTVDLGDGVPMQSWPIRTTSDFPDDRSIHLLHLHGSLGWLRVPGGTRKFSIQALRDANVWARIASGELQVEPVVVLTDRKDNVPGTAPFSLGYKILADRLAASDLWCVAGYGLLDAPVNRTLVEAARTRHDAGLPQPRLLVLGYGDPDEINDLFQTRVGPIAAQLFVSGAGVPAFIGDPQWDAWIGA